LTSPSKGRNPLATLSFPPRQPACRLYLPIAEVSVNAFLILGIGGIVGFLSGMFGVGGGFLITPLLFFIGVPPAVAVATGANQVVASSVSGVLAQLKRKAVDFRMGLVLLAGGVAGSAVGVWVFQMMRAMGQVDLFVQLSYVVFLGFIGAMMFAGKPARLLAHPTAGRAGAPRACAQLGTRPAAEDEVPRQRAVYQRHPAGADRCRGRLSGRDHGGGRRLHHGARDDLPVWGCRPRW
jgi:hypothetical protein